jgi:hypothetical protein
MLSFNQFYYLEESRFRDRKNQIHLMDVPMFSIFIDKDLEQTESTKLESYKNILNRACAQARNKIHKLGFSSMHANLVIRDLSGNVNKNTGGGVAAYAHRKGKYMSISKEMIKHGEYLVDIIVHEWAHLWMYNNSKSFKLAVKEYYNLLKDYYIESEPRKLTREEKDRIEAAWITTFPKSIERLASDDNETLAAYLMQRNKITIKDFKRLPHLFTMWGKARQEIIVTNYRKQSKMIPKGGDIYVAKVGEGWLVGSGESQRWETFIEWQVPIINLDILENPEEAFEKASKQYKAHYKISPVRDLKPKIYSAVRGAYTIIARKLGIPEENEDFVSKASEIIWKKFSTWLKNPIIMRTPYDELWVSNPHKPHDFSLTKTLTSEFIKHSKDERENINYSGEKYNNVRQLASALVRWVTEYGMSNDDELWATAIEYYKKLPKDHQRKIMELMRK